MYKYPKHPQQDNKKKILDKGKTKHVGKAKKSPIKTTPNTTLGPSVNLRSQLKDKAKHTAALIQEITEELQAVEEESSKKDQDLGCHSGE